MTATDGAVASASGMAAETMALMTILLVIIVGFARNGLGFFKLFVPSGVPWLLLPIISLMARPPA